MYEFHDGAAEPWALLGASSVSLSALRFGTDARYQNTAEFLAVVVGMIGLLDLLRDRPPVPVTVELRGDSVTALQWAESSRFRGDLIGNAAAVFALILVRANVIIPSMVHVPGEDNVLCDLLSRPDLQGRMRLVQDVVPEAKDLQLSDLDGVIEAVRLSDPRIDHLSPSAFGDFWSSACQLVGRL